MLRNWANWGGGLLLWLLFCFMMLMFSQNPANSLVELALVGTFFVVICYLISLATMFSYVKATPATLVVVNPGSSTSIPWARVRAVRAEHGLSVEVDGLGSVECYAFQRSLIGRLIGYPGARRAAKKIDRFKADRATLSAGDPEVETPWRRHVSWLFSGWVAFSLLVPLLVRVIPAAVQ